LLLCRWTAGRPATSRSEGAIYDVSLGASGTDAASRRKHDSTAGDVWRGPDRFEAVNSRANESLLAHQGRSGSFDGNPRMDWRLKGCLTYGSARGLASATRSCS
jgi:hypothetical protein